MGPITMQLAADKHIRLALEEDISSEDVSTNLIIPECKRDEVQPIYREDGIVARLQIFERVFTLPDPETKVAFDVRGGEEAKRGQHLATATEGVRILLSDERTALNYLQQLNGTVTYTRTVTGMLEGTGTRLLNARKTTSCIRIFEGYTVRIRGGQNHRYNLSDGVLLKDNHIDAARGVRKTVTATRACTLFIHRIEAETENLDMMKEAVDAGADIIMLDNMTPEQVAEAIRYIDGRAETECSDNMTKESIRTIIELGVGHVFSGILTRSSPILDASLKHLEVLAD